MLKKRKVLKVSVLLAVLALCMQVTIPAFAYFQRGDVKVKAGKQSVTLEQGGSENVSVTLTPSSSQQLPGCGMAECPQSCGEKECLDANGECTCNGTNYQTYYAYATASSSNTSVATAKYDNGTVNIKGVAPGTATITLTASMRQYTSTSTTINVTVSEKNNNSNAGQNGNQNAGNNNTNNGQNNAGQNHNNGSGNTGNNTADFNNGNNTGNNNGNAGNGVVAKAVNGGSDSSQNGAASNAAGQDQNAQTVDGQNPDGQNTDAQAAQEAQEGITTINSDRGQITFVPIIDGVQGKDQLTAIMGQEAYVDFQKKDEAGTVLYAWEFCGKDLIAAEDMNYGITTSTTAFEGCKYGSSADSLYLAFAQEGGFPGKASIFLKVDDQFQDGKTLNLYRYLANGNAEPVSEGLEIQNGYVTMQLDQGGNYILTTQTFDTEDVTDITSAAPEARSTGSGNHGVKPAMIAVVVIIIIVVIAAILLFLKKKKGTDPTGTSVNETPEYHGDSDANGSEIDQTVQNDQDSSIEVSEDNQDIVQDQEDNNGKNV